MAEKKCLGKFAEHSLWPWMWYEEKKVYFRGCLMPGCSFEDYAEELNPVSGTRIINAPLYTCDHRWDPWFSNEFPGKVCMPPWYYKRTCRACGAIQLAQGLER